MKNSISQEKADEQFMKRCLQLAKLGLGNTYPNPLVGSVIVKNNIIIGEGWHKKAGEAHAEVNAINSVKNKEQIVGSTLYVNLEPCNHFGKTPPCTQSIIQNKISRVVIGTTDRNIQVKDLGVKKLTKNGVLVKKGVLVKDCLELNKRFFTFHEKKRPFILLKWAEDTCGNMGSKNKEDGAISISNNLSRQKSHVWRSQEQAILVGKNTALQDKPSLNTRLVDGNSPIKVLIDSDLSVPNSTAIFNSATICYVITDVKSNYTDTEIKKHLTIDFSDDKNKIKKIIDKLYEIGIQSILVEGGSFTLQKFLDIGIWDEAKIFKSGKNIAINSPIAAPRIENSNAVLKEKFLIKNDIIFSYFNLNNQSEK